MDRYILASLAGLLLIVGSSLGHAADEEGHGAPGGGCGTLYDYMQWSGQGSYLSAHTGPSGASSSSETSGWTKVGTHHHRNNSGESTLKSGWTNSYASHDLCEL